ncbi:MAG: hypothetical protein JNK64_12690 [Myxococcales bacterium]|nr:hypothetical protein [Myxococcales bacterium]
MAWFDLDGFLASLPPRGVAEAHVPLYREAAETLLAGAGAGRYGAAMLEDALARETMAGASERRLANLRRVGEAMIAYVGQGAQTIAGPAVAVAPVVTAAASPPAAAPPIELDLAIDVPRRAPATGAPAMRGGYRGGGTAPPVFDAPPRPGCICRKREDVYLDDYWQEIGTMYVGFASVVGGVIWLFAPPFTWLTVSSGLLAGGALITGLTAGWRCESCRRWIARRGLDADERADARLRGLAFLGIAAVLAIVCGFAFGEARELWHRSDPVKIDLGD